MSGLADVSKRATCCDVELLGGGVSEAYSVLRVMLFDFLHVRFASSI